MRAEAGINPATALFWEMGSGARAQRRRAGILRASSRARWLSTRLATPGVRCPTSPPTRTPPRRCCSVSSSAIGAGGRRPTRHSRATARACPRSRRRGGRRRQAGAAEEPRVPQPVPVLAGRNPGFARGFLLGVDDAQDPSGTDQCRRWDHLLDRARGPRRTASLCNGLHGMRERGRRRFRTSQRAGDFARP